MFSHLMPKEGSSHYRQSPSYIDEGISLQYDEGKQRKVSYDDLRSYREQFGKFYQRTTKGCILLNSRSSSNLISQSLRFKQGD